MVDFQKYTRERRGHWDGLGTRERPDSSFSSFYRNGLSSAYSFRIPPGERVLEIGCGCGDLLLALRPGFGVGIDFSEKIIAFARDRHGNRPEVSFFCADAHDFVLPGNETFDYIIMSDLINDLWDVQAVFAHVRRFCHDSSRLLINWYSRLWELPIKFAQQIGLGNRNLQQNWLTVEDIKHLFALSGWEFLYRWTEILVPAAMWPIGDFLNRFLARTFPFSELALCNFVLARPEADRASRSGEFSVSVIVPARNEAGNIPAILERVPKMGICTELVFVEGNSTDDTRRVFERELPRFGRLPASLYFQTGKGKGDAVRLGFSKARGDILMILDADMTVAPEDLPKFHDALVGKKGDFINGVRLVYPLEQESMRFLNLVGNKFFSLGFSWILGQSIKDTLCGTKVLWRRDYQKIAANRVYFGDFDPFGDFDLIFGAAKLNLKILDLPVRYVGRSYGESNIDRWRHGWLLLQMLIFAARRLKFV